MLKRALFTELSRIGQALSAPQRIEILDYLAQAPRSVDILSQLTGLSIANTSRHLQVLKNVSLVGVKQQGRQRIYFLADDDVVHLLQALRQTAENHLAQVQQLLQEYPDSDSDIHTMSLDELKTAIQRDEVLLLDVRPEEEYQAGHIPNAINVPPDRIEDIEAFLPEDEIQSKRLVAYCRGPYCVYAHKAAQQLKQRAIQVARLEEGLPEWRAKGYETVSEKVKC